MEVGGHYRDPAALPPETDWAPILQEAEWAAGKVWTVVEILAVTSNPT
jgi:hypothetical protein